MNHPYYLIMGRQPRQGEVWYLRGRTVGLGEVRTAEKDGLGDWGLGESCGPSGLNALAPFHRFAVSPFRYSVSLSPSRLVPVHWIPAFAGMTDVAQSQGLPLA